MVALSKNGLKLNHRDKIISKRIIFKKHNLNNKYKYKWKLGYDLNIVQNIYDVYEQ